MCDCDDTWTVSLSHIVDSKLGGGWRLLTADEAAVNRLLLCDFNRHYPVSSQPWLHIWRTSFLDLHTAKTFATSIVHSKLDYCNSLYYRLPKFQINRLQHIQNYLARTVVQAPKFKHITPILKSLHWLKVSERIEYKIISLTYKILNATQPSYLYDLVSIQPPHGHNTCALHLMSLSSNHHHHSKSLLIDPSDMLHLIFGTSFQHHSEFLIQIIHPPLSDLHFKMPV